MRTAKAGLYIRNGRIDLISTVGGDAVQLAIIVFHFERGGPSE